MKVIANGGAATKNVKKNTTDAIKLALSKDYINGIKIKLYLTKDNEVITLSDEVYNFFTKTLKQIDDYTLRDLLFYNIGTKVKQSSITTLKEVLHLVENKGKDLILDFINTSNKNALLVDIVLKEIKPYQKSINILLESESKEIVEYLKSSTTNVVGIKVTEKSINNFYFNESFYDITTTLLDNLNIIDKLKNKKIIMIDKVNRIEVFDLIYQQYKDYFTYIYIITDEISTINKHELLKK